METIQSVPERSVPGHAGRPGGRYDRTPYAAERRHRHLGYGWSLAVADSPVYAPICGHGRRVGPGMYGHPVEGDPHREQFLSFQHAVYDLQAVPLGEAAKESMVDGDLAKLDLIKCVSISTDLFPRQGLEIAGLVRRSSLHVATLWWYPGR